MSYKSPSVPAKILSSYKQYVDYGYPSDPNVYQIRGNPSTINKLIDYISLNIQVRNVSLVQRSDNGIKIWGFNVKEDLDYRDGRITFGPELVDLKME